MDHQEATLPARPTRLPGGRARGQEPGASQKQSWEDVEPHPCHLPLTPRLLRGWTAGQGPQGRATGLGGAGLGRRVSEMRAHRSPLPHGVQLSLGHRMSQPRGGSSQAPRVPPNSEGGRQGVRRTCLRLQRDGQAGVKGVGTSRAAGRELGSSA